MKQQEVFKKIGGIIREINEQYEYLETVEGPLNELELELMVANSHFLTDHIEILRKLNAHTALTPTPQPQLPPAHTEPAVEAATPEPVKEPSYFQPFAAQPEDEEEAQTPVTYLDETPANTFEFEIIHHTDHFPVTETIVNEAPEPAAQPEPVAEVEPETIRHELTLDEIGGDWDEDEDEPADTTIPDTQPVLITPLPVPQPVPVFEKPEEPAAPAPQPAPEPFKPEPVFQQPEPTPEPVAERPLFTPVTQPKPMEPPHTKIMVEEAQVLTLNERMSAQMGAHRMSDNLQLQPISDLKSAISLNDKLLYIKDLFNGYGLAYSEAIDTLNRFKTFSEAESFLKSTYATKNNWQDRPATADKFYTLLQRRYV